MIYGLHEYEAQDPLRVGHKAANLARLTAIGFRVPWSWVIGTKFYDEFISFPGIAEKLKALWVGEADDAIANLFLQVSLPKRLIYSLQEIPQVAMANSFAVRSSSTAEDLAEASFAGVFSSFVDVQCAALEDAIRLVWASAHFYGARTYCARLGLSAASLKMGVIIQRFVHARAHGVLFTQGATADELYIDVETYQQQKLEIPSHYRIARSDFSVNRHLYGAAECNVLSSDDLRLLCRTAIQIESSLGSAQDIEWIFDLDDTLYILQSRPITIRDLD